jgi:uncharacterized protein
MSLCTKAFSQTTNNGDTTVKATGWVIDFENIFTDKQEQKLTQLITDFEKKTTVEIAILTVDTTVVSQDKFDSYILTVANRWGVGKAGKDNGVMIGVSAGHRYMSIQNGHGIKNKLTDADTKRIIDNQFLPQFKRGKYYKGTKAGLKALMKELESAKS